MTPKNQCGRTCVTDPVTGAQQCTGGPAPVCKRDPVTSVTTCGIVPSCPALAAATPVPTLDTAAYVVLALAVVVLAVLFKKIKGPL